MEIKEIEEISIAIKLKNGKLGGVILSHDEKFKLMDIAASFSGDGKLKCFEFPEGYKMVSIYDTLDK